MVRLLMNLGTDTRVDGLLMRHGTGTRVFGLHSDESLLRNNMELMTERHGGAADSFVNYTTIGGDKQLFRTHMSTPALRGLQLSHVSLITGI